MHDSQSTMPRGLWLHEELVLLALDDESGRWHSAGMVDQAVGGALLAELLLARAIELDGERKPKVVLRRALRFDDEPLDEAVAQVADAGKPRTASDWVGRFAQLRDLRTRIARELCRLGVLEEVEGKLLFLFTTRRFPTRDPGPEYYALERLRTAIFTDGEVDERSALLVALADAAGLLAVRFPAARLKERKARIATLRDASACGSATSEAIAAVQTAIAASTAATAVVVATVTS